MSFNESILRAAEACRKLLPDPFPVDVGLILGSGLGASADRFLREGAQAIRYADIPGMPVTHVSGHAGRLVAVDGCDSPRHVAGTQPFLRRTRSKRCRLRNSIACGIGNEDSDRDERGWRDQINVRAWRSDAD